MTHEYFIELQKAVYNTSMEDEWNQLFKQFNFKYNKMMNRISYRDHIFILQAIAKRQGFDFNGTDIHKYSPINKIW